jgi:hypothetical protein
MIHAVTAGVVKQSTACALPDILSERELKEVHKVVTTDNDAESAVDTEVPAALFRCTCIWSWSLFFSISEEPTPFPEPAPRMPPSAVTTLWSQWSLSRSPSPAPALH